MSFATSIRDGWLEWCGSDLRALFGQRRNLLRPRFALFLRDVLKFNSRAVAAVSQHPDLTLDQLITHMKLGDWFRRYYLLPMAAAIWSCPLNEMLSFPARSLVQFFANHHLLSATGQPQWYTVSGGSQEYVRRLIAPFERRIRTQCGVTAITRQDGKVQIHDSQGGLQSYDEVVMACHGDEALALLQDRDSVEHAALAPFRYQKNLAVLHRDESVMPQRRRCWASWVYTSDGESTDPAITASYWMNRLQRIDETRPLFVSLNPGRAIAEHLIFDEFEFDHPVFDKSVLEAQARVQALQGARNTWFCGAHLGHGFHEDGLSSAVTVARLMGSAIPWKVAAREPVHSEPRPRSRPLFPGLAAAFSRE
jgi:hypothetical protein